MCKHTICFNTWHLHFAQHNINMCVFTVIDCSDTQTIVCQGSQPLPTKVRHVIYGAIFEIKLLKLIYSFRKHGAFYKSPRHQKAWSIFRRVSLRETNCKLCVIGYFIISFWTGLYYNFVLRPIPRNFLWEVHIIPLTLAHITSVPSSAPTLFFMWMRLRSTSTSHWFLWETYVIMDYNRRCPHIKAP